MTPPLFLTPGDPLGIGPEVACRALAAGADARGVLVGHGPSITHAAAAAGLTVVPCADLAAARAHDGPGVPLVTPRGPEPVEVAAVRAVAEHLLDGAAGALVTGPIHKGRLTARGFPHLGHTDFLGALCGVERPVMAFVGGRLRVALVTVHVPLRRVPEVLTRDGVLHTIRVAADALAHPLGLDRRRLLVCGLNPHAGDDGALGHEDAEIVAPACAAARAEGLDVVGPVSAEHAFRAAMGGEGDLVVAMYHDQGLAPLKVVDFGQSVNWTLGLPIHRTSVDHGTADDLVGTGRADPSSMAAAIRWARHLVSGG